MASNVTEAEKKALDIFDSITEVDFDALIKDEFLSEEDCIITVTEEVDSKMAYINRFSVSDTLKGKSDYSHYLKIRN